MKIRIPLYTAYIIDEAGKEDTTDYEEYVRESSLRDMGYEYAKKNFKEAVRYEYLNPQGVRIVESEKLDSPEKIGLYLDCKTVKLTLE